VFLLADDGADVGAAVVGEGLGGVLEQAGALAGLARRHRRREVDEPARVDGEAAHDLEGGGAVVGGDAEVGAQAGRDRALAEQVGEVEEVVVACWADRFSGVARSGRVGSQ
jgi:hypothetical protein